MSKPVKFINQFILALASVRSGFVFASLGVITQTFHIYFIILEFASFTNWLRFLEAIIGSVFLSGGLIYNTINAGKAEGFEAKQRYQRKAKIFTVLEVTINLYYWLDKLLFQYWSSWDLVDIPAIIMAVIFSVSVPLIIQSYAGELKIQEIEKEQIKEVDADRLDAIEAKVSEFTEGPITMKMDEVDNKTLTYKVRFNTQDSQEST